VGLAIGRAAFGPPESSAARTASKVDPAVVDITTTLAYRRVGAAGTGVVLGSSGVVLTNNHVIEGAGTIRVTDVGNGDAYRATVIGTDLTADIALLRLTGASHLDTVGLGDSSTVTTGAAVVALGNAGGMGGAPSISTGVVEALGSSIIANDEITGGSEQLNGLIQTNARLEPGDSGGPLVDRSGRVIGIDTAGSTSYQIESGSDEGFAIPIDAALDIARQIESGLGSAAVHIGPTAFLGVQVSASATVSGAVVAAVVAGSPAQRAGLVVGDVIVSVGDAKVESPSTLTDLMQSHHPGDVVTVTWVGRSATRHSATVSLATGPPQ
jgi:S1-C subfamily serine protease